MATDNVNKGTTVPVIDTTTQEETPIKSNKSNLLPITLGALFFFLLVGMGAYILLVKNAQRLPQNQSKTVILPSTTTVSPTFSSIQPTSSIGSDVQSSILVYENPSYSNSNTEPTGVILLKGLNSKQIVIDSDGTSPSYSSVLQKIAYVNPGRVGKDNAVYIYDLKTDKTEELKETAGDGTLNTALWSPDGKYIVTVSSTYVLGGIDVYEYPSGKKIASFGAYLELPAVQWDSNGDIIFRDSEAVTPPRQYGSGEGVGIARISLPSGQKQILLHANAQYDYHLAGVNNNIIYYLPLNPNNPVEANKQVASPTDCWQIDSNGQNNKSVDCKSIPSDQITSIVSSNLPASLSGYAVTNCTPNSRDPKWMVCSFYKSSTSPGGPANKIGLFNLNQPQVSVKVIADGNNPSW